MKALCGTEEIKCAFLFILLWSFLCDLPIKFNNEKKKKNVVLCCVMLCSLLYSHGNDETDLFGICHIY